MGKTQGQRRQSQQNGAFVRLGLFEQIVYNITMEILEKNLKAISKKNETLYQKLLSTKANDDYTKVTFSKTSSVIPIFKNGHLFYSKYNPQREMENLFQAGDEFILFCGIGAGLQVEFFLKKFPEKFCAICEPSKASLKSLLQIVDLSEIILNKHVRILEPIFEENFAKSFAENYLPALDGNLRVISLRTWENFYADKLHLINAKIYDSLKLVETDFLTQANFGKVWLKNILRNLQLASTFTPSLPILDRQKTAVICGAGPSLTEKIPYIKKKSAEIVIFATDTSFLPLIKNGIEVDFFLSVDPQVFSLLHFKPNFAKNQKKASKKTVGIFDLCCLNSLARFFLQNGNPILFTASRHPLVQYASAFGIFPFAESGYGTVALYALDVAHRLGFTKFETSGLDFCYVGGKTYANGSYLEHQALNSGLRFFPCETFFTKLMFRSKVTQKKLHTRLDYETEMLLYYKRQAETYQFDGELWNTKPKFFTKFNYNKFFETLLADIKAENLSAKTAMLPFLAYCKKYGQSCSVAELVKTLLRI